jgi:hypothetical protein
MLRPWTIERSVRAKYFDSTIAEMTNITANQPTIAQRRSPASCCRGGQVAANKNILATCGFPAKSARSPTMLSNTSPTIGRRIAPSSDEIRFATSVCRSTCIHRDRPNRAQRRPASSRTITSNAGMNITQSTTKMRGTAALAQAGFGNSSTRSARAPKDHRFTGRCCARFTVRPSTHTSQCNERYWPRPTVGTSQAQGPQGSGCSAIEGSQNSRDAAHP